MSNSLPDGQASNWMGSSRNLSMLYGLPLVSCTKVQGGVTSQRRVSSLRSWAAAVEEGPDGAHARLDAALRGKTVLHLYDRHVRRLVDQTEQVGALRIELGTPRLTLTVRRPLPTRARPAHPHNRRGDPDLELGRRPPSRHPAESRIDHTITQILAVSSRHGRSSIPYLRNRGLALFAQFGNRSRNRKTLNLL